MLERFKLMLGNFRKKLINGRIRQLEKMHNNLESEVQHLRATLNSEDEWMMKCKKKTDEIVCTTKAENET